MWHIDVILGYDFLTGGSLGYRPLVGQFFFLLLLLFLTIACTHTIRILLDLDTSTVESDLSCLTRTGGMLHPNTDECTVAVDARFGRFFQTWFLCPSLKFISPSHHQNE